MAGRNPNMTTEEFRQHWCAALRSGEYKQCKKVLCDLDYGYCCLGVACEVYHNLVAPLDTEETTLSIGFDHHETRIKRFNGQSMTLPFEVQKIANMSGAAQFEPKSSADYKTLTELNDLAGKSFEEIATAIETFPFLSDVTIEN